MGKSEDYLEGLLVGLVWGSFWFLFFRLEIEA